MKTPDPRLGEIEARAKEAEPLCVSSCPSELCRAENDRAYLLTELRNRDDVIARVLKLCDKADASVTPDFTGYKSSSLSTNHVRAAVTAAKGDGA